MMKIKTVFLLLAVALLCCSPISPPGKAESVFNPETDEGYFILSDEKTQYIRQNNNLYLLQFEEDGHRRYLIAHLPKNITEHANTTVHVKDFFTGETVLVTRITSDFTHLEEPYWISDKYFKEGTAIENVWIHFDLGGQSWFWGENPNRSPRNYDDLRAFYETVFPPEQRFPRKQIEPADHPQSRIPRERDHLPLSDFPNIVELKVRFEDQDKYQGEVYLFAEIRMKEEIIDKKVTHTHEYYELFTGTWLHTRTAVENDNKERSWYAKLSYQLNNEYLQALSGGRKILESYEGWGSAAIGEDKYKTYYTSETTVTPYYEGSNSIYLVGKYSRYVKEAETIGDLRRIYEMLPRYNWFVPIVYETAAVPAYNPPNKTFRPVWDANTLRDALAKAKNGDTIVVLCDIRLADRHFFQINNKKITIRGLEGQRPCILWDIDIDITRERASSYSIFITKKSNILIEDLRIEATFAARCFQIEDKSTLTLGKGSEISGFGNVVKAYNGSTLVVDGAYIHHNTFSVFINNGYIKHPMSKMRLISGEIAYNRSNWCTIDACDFIMDGGSIHHNSVPDQMSILFSYGKMEINGGEIRDNFGCYIIDFTASSAKMTGGTVSGNTGIYSGGINIRDTSKYKTSFLMTGGSVHDNFLCLNSYNYEDSFLDSNAQNLQVSSLWGKEASFTMSGGSIYQSQPQGDIPSIIVYGSKGKISLSKDAQVDPNSIVLKEGGKMENKLKK